MADLNLYDNFGYDLASAQHNFLGSGDIIKVALTNEPQTGNLQTFIPAAGNQPPPTLAFGYPVGGIDIQNALSNYTITETKFQCQAPNRTITFTASGGDIGPFRYAVLYNDTNPSKYLIGWYDNAYEYTINNGDTFDIVFSEPIMYISAWTG